MTPDMLQAIGPLLLILVKEGMANGIPQEVKLRDAFHQCLMSRQDLLAGWSMEDALSATTQHLQSCLGMCRAFAREELEGSQDRRFPKSGGFRRKMSIRNSEYIVEIAQLLNADSSHEVGMLQEEMNEAKMSKPPSSEAIEPSEISGLKIGNDDHDFVPCFQDWEAVDAVPIAADLDWPSWCKPSATPQRAANIEPITPVSRKRKQAAKTRDPDEQPSTPQPPAAKVTKPATKVTKPAAKVTKKPAAQVTKKQKNRIAAELNPDNYKPIVKTYLCKTSETPARCELTGRLESGTRIHVCTMTHKSHGPGFSKFASQLQQAIDKDGMTKREAEVLAQQRRVLS